MRKQVVIQPPAPSAWKTKWLIAKWTVGLTIAGLLLSVVWTIVALSVILVGVLAFKNRHQFTRRYRYFEFNSRSHGARVKGR